MPIVFHPASPSGDSGIRSWRTAELMAATTIGVVLGVAYWAWSAAYTALYSPFASIIGPSVGLLGGPWLLAGVVSGLVVRRPGAALLAELLAAAVEALLGNQWGWGTVLSGTLQGVGVEAALGLFAFRWFGWPVAALGGALAAALETIYEWHAFWADLSTSWRFSYLAFFVTSGALVAGVGGWLLTRALTATGAIDALPAGREAVDAHH